MSIGGKSKGLTYASHSSVDVFKISGISQVADRKIVGAWKINGVTTITRQINNEFSMILGKKSNIFFSSNMQLTSVRSESDFLKRVRLLPRRPDTPF